MTHRKYGRSRQRIHRGMARNLGGRKPLWMRMEQSTTDPYHDIIEQAQKLKESAAAEKPKHWAKSDIFKPAKGFIRQLFNRKTG